MHWWHELKYIMRKLNRRRAEQEAEEEIRTHLELETREKIEAGLSSEDARYAARRAFGSVALATENSRAVWGLRALEILWQDLRYGVRMLLKKPGFSVIAIFTLALGIGANTAIFSVVNGVLLKPLPYHQPEELVSVKLIAQGLGNKDLVVSASAYFIFREQSHTFQDIGLYNFPSVNVTGLGEPERMPALGVTDGLLPILGVTPSLGRSFTRADDPTI
jgi:MacB-like periplasmic core domain